MQIGRSTLATAQARTRMRAGRWVSTALLALALGLAGLFAGCGGGSDSAPASTPGTARIGAAGGTVSGDDGASVTVPAGALKQDSTVTLSISKNAAGAPVAPPGDSFIPVSNVFTITPHGHGFAEPVRVTLPFDASLVQSTDQLVILKAQPLGQWVAHGEVTRQGATATLEVRDFSVFMVALRAGTRFRPVATAPPAVPFSFSLAVSGTSPNLTITYTFSGTRPTCAGGDRLETVFMTVTDDSYNEPVLRLPVHNIVRAEQLAVAVPGFSAPAPALTGASLSHQVIQPAHSAGGSYGSGSLSVSPYVKGRYSCNSELLAANAVGAPWTLASANEAFLPDNASGMALLADIADIRTSVGAPVNSRARAQTTGSSGLSTRSKWEISRDNGASWSVYKLGAERVSPDTSYYGEAAAQAAGLWAIEGELPPFAATDNGALLRFSACTAIAALYSSGAPASLPCASGAPHPVSVAFLAQPPSFTVMPAPMAVVAGTAASFSVLAAGLPTPALQWQRRLPHGAWQDIAGATATTFTVPAATLAQDGTQFQAVASNSSGSAVSALATLNVVDQAAAPSITAVSGSLTVVQGGSAVFAATVRGTEPLSFQWRRNGADVLGANTPILRLDAVADAHAGSYVLVVGNPAGTAQGAVQQLGVAAAGTVLPTAPSIVTQPVAVRVNAGNTATFAVGTGGSGPQAYQWKRNNVDIAGATAAFYSIDAAAPGDAAAYAVVVSNGAGTATSASAVLTVDAAIQPAAPPSITAQPGAVVVAPGMSATLGVGVQGSGPMSFQWSRNGVAIAGQTQAIYTVAAASALDAGNYQVRVGNSVGEVSSATAQLILLGAPGITTQPADRSVSEGASATFNVSASGDYPRYQWTRNQVAIAGATGAAYTTPALTPADSGAVYGAIVYNGAGLVFSQGAVLTVSAAPVAPQWQGAIALRASDGFSASRAVVAAGATGQFVAAWLDMNENGAKELRASRYRPGEGWSPAETVAIVTSNSGATMGHALAMDAAGNAVVVFTSQSNSRQSIWASRQQPTGGWSPPVLLETEDGGQAELPALAIDGQGSATAVWQQNDTVFFPNLLATRRIVASRFVVGLGWSAPLDIDFATGGNGTGLNIHVGASAAGDVVVGWTGDTSAGQVAAANVFRPTAGWVGAQQLVAGTTPTTASSVGGAAINDAGLALVTFRRLPSTTSNVFVARYTPSSGWAGPELLGPNGDAARVALGGDGTATVVWENSPAGNQIVVTRRSAAGVWGAPLVAGAGFAPALGRDADGTVVLAWLSNPGVRSVMSARWPSNGALTSATVIESDVAAPTGWISGGLAVGANGHAAAVWTEGASTDAVPWANVFR